MQEYVIWFIEAVFGLAMFINAVLFLPQAINLYKTKSTKGLSLITFVGFNIIQLFSVLHGYIRNDKIFMFGMLLSLLFCGSVTFLIIYYKIKYKTT
jgi:MtN3 and saliva related transmembrane protein